MSRIDEIFNEFENASKHPYQAIEKYNTENKKVIGLVPYFTPYELVHAAGMYPVEIWGGEIEPSEAHSYYPAFYCSVLLTLLEYAMRGDYNFMEGVIIPTTCDGLRNLEENWKIACPNQKVIPLVQPANRKSAPAEIYYVNELHRVQHELEEISGKKLLDSDLFYSLQLYNKQKAAMRLFSAVAADHLDVVTPLKRHYAFKAAQIMPVEVHTALINELIEQLQAMPQHNFAGKRLVATSIIIDSIELLAELEKQGFGIVGDDMPSESKKFEVDAPDHVDPFVSLARIWPNIEGCSVLYDPKKLRGPMLIDLAKERKADGVLISIVKFCEEEEFDYPVLKKDFEAAGIPMLYLEMENQAHLNEQAATRIQAFAEMLD